VNTNTGFYEAWIPSGTVDKMGIANPGQLAAKQCPLFRRVR